MIRRRKLELVLADIRQWLARPEHKERSSELWHSTRNVIHFTEELQHDAAKTRALIAVTREVRRAAGPGRTNAEEHLMRSLEILARDGCQWLEDQGVTRQSGLNAALALAPELQPTCQVLRELHDYALECFHYTRPRDSFAGLRRAGAFAIFTPIGWLFDLPEVVKLAQQAVQRGRRGEAWGASTFLEEYFKERGAAPDDATVDELLELASRTDSRATAVGALNVLVETGVISEFEALDRISEWKDKHYHRRPEATE